jgi:hypothetical protein
MKLPQLTLRDLFWFVTVVAMGCTIGVYSSNLVVPSLVDVIAQVSLVVGAAVIAGRYISRTPFSAGFVVGVGIGLLFGQLSQSPLRHLLQDWIMPEGINGGHRMVTVAVRTAPLVYGLLGGVIAVAVSRAHKY